MRFIAYLSALTNKGGVYKHFTNDLLPNTPYFL